MENKILTIAIPAYNMEKYIDRCISSVTNSPEIDTLDIIVVNDGSKDRTLALAKAYEDKYPHSVRVIDKPNGGWGTCINTAIRAAKGKYIKTLDSDDWFDTAALSQFVALLRTLDVDHVLSTHNEVDDKGNVTRTMASNGPKNQPLSFNEYAAAGCGTSIHGLTYRTSLLQEHNYEVAPRFYGDLDYILLPLSYVRTSYICELNIYQYFVGRPGQSISFESYAKNYKDFLFVTEKLLKFQPRLTDQNAGYRRIFEINVLPSIVTCYRLLMMKRYKGSEAASKTMLKEFDQLLKTSNPSLYKQSNSKKGLGIIPYIALWRSLGINIFKILNV